MIYPEEMDGWIERVNSCMNIWNGPTKVCWGSANHRPYTCLICGYVFTVQPIQLYKKDRRFVIVLSLVPTEPGHPAAFFNLFLRKNTSPLFS